MTKVKIFTTTTCPYCHALKRYLDQQDIRYEEVNLNEHPEEIRTSVDTCGSMGVPCTHVVQDDGSEETILGFDQNRINRALGIG